MSTRLKCVHEIALTAEPTGLGAPSCHIVALAKMEASRLWDEGGTSDFAGLPALVWYLFDTGIGA
jgi:hypothetical protein